MSCEKKKKKPLDNVNFFFRNMWVKKLSKNINNII